MFTILLLTAVVGLSIYNLLHKQAKVSEADDSELEKKRSELEVESIMHPKLKTTSEILNERERERKRIVIRRKTENFFNFLKERTKKLGREDEDLTDEEDDYQNDQEDAEDLHPTVDN